MSLKRLPTALTLEQVKNSKVDKDDPHIKFILKHIGTGNTVLDVGCCLGHISDMIAKLGNKVVGIDITPELIEEAKKNFSNVKFMCVDAMALQNYFSENDFDYVVAGEVIEHVLDPTFFLKEILKILKKDGKLILTTQNSNGIQFRIRMLLGRFRWDPTHFRLYSKSEIINEVRSAGFIIDDVKIIPIKKRGILRSVVHYISRIYPNFGWTIGVVCRKS